MIRFNTPLEVKFSPIVPAGVQALCVLVPRDDHAAWPDARVAAGLQAMRRGGALSGRKLEVASQVIGEGARSVRIFAVGLGDLEKISAETVRLAAATLARHLRKQRISVATLLTRVAGKVDGATVVESVTTGAILSAFEFTEFRGEVGRKKIKEEGEPPVLELSVVGPAPARANFDRARTVAMAQNYARTIATRPPNKLNPPTLAAEAQSMARETGLKCSVFDEKKLEALGMGGLLAVGMGSSPTPPRLIILEHIPSTKAKKTKGPPAPTYLLVGKAVTFDTGGISIKPAQGMQGMVFDKCGAMAVLGAMRAIAELDLPVHVVGLLAAAENHISATAYRPGDILKFCNGVTAEITNTDAEGRLVLADALAWGCETYKPAAVVDLATLTGGVVIALGKSVCGMFASNDLVAGEMQRAFDSSGELTWRLPIMDCHMELMKSDVADILNSSAAKEAHPIQGAAFLRHFVPEKTPWVHLDIAGTAVTEKETPLYHKGSTGFGVRTLVEWLRARVQS